MNGLYFYKLVSSFPEDVTKDCKLTVNEIDHNFMVLKKSDISDLTFDRERSLLILETKGGEKFQASLSGYTKDLQVVYDKKNGSIQIHHDGIVDVIDDLVTKCNIASEILSNVTTDDTLVGNGTPNNPLGLVSTEKTNSFKSVIKVIDKTKGMCLPDRERNSFGDRYLTYEYYNDYGYLYNYNSASRFVKDLASDWRIPTKADWDNMLNAIELCDEDRNHDISSCNNVLGKFAGKFLKSNNNWVNGKTDLCCDDICDDIIDDCTCDHTCCHPHPKPITPNGTNSYGMSILPSGYGDGGMMLDYFGRRAKFWTSTSIQVTNMYVKRFDYDKSGVVQVADSPQAIASVRLVKDYNGSNYRSIENIGGINYTCVLMPAKNTATGHLIWMGSNLATTNKKYCPVTPNYGEYISERKVFFINEWNGFDWIRKELKEGDSLMIKFGPDNDKNAEYRLVNGELINIKKDIISSVENKYDDDIDDLKGRVDVIESEISDIKQSIDSINTSIDELNTQQSQLNEKIENEAATREEIDTQIWEAINNEVTVRENTEKQIWDAISNEATARENTDTQIWEAINNEVAVREDAEKQIWEAINNEVAVREDAEKQIWGAINNEVAVREDAEKQIWDAVNNEIERSTTEDKRLISKSGSTYNCAQGELVLKADSPENDIVIKLDSNYGTF